MPICAGIWGESRGKSAGKRFLSAPAFWVRNVNTAVNLKISGAENIPVCPEVLGGLRTPRTPAEIRDERVITKDGRDVTEEYVRGAEETLQIAREKNCRRAVLKERSPSCGSGFIYDGTFSKKLIPGDGITVRLLKKAGICVYGENSLPKKAEP